MKEIKHATMIVEDTDGEEFVIDIFGARSVEVSTENEPPDYYLHHPIILNTYIRSLTFKFDGLRINPEEDCSYRVAKSLAGKYRDQIKYDALMEAADDYDSSHHCDTPEGKWMRFRAEQFLTPPTSESREENTPMKTVGPDLGDPPTYA